MPRTSVSQTLDLNALIAFIQKNWPAVTAAAVVFATLIMLKRRKKPVAVACYPLPDELPPKRSKPYVPPLKRTLFFGGLK